MFKKAVSSIVGYVKFIINQLAHMQKSSWMLWLFSLGAQLMIWLNTGSPLNFINLLTFIGTSLGVLTVVSINSCKSINGYFGILSAICFIIISFTAKNYLAIGEQLAYVFTLDLPVLISTTWNKNMAAKIRHFGPKQWFISIVFTVAVWLLSGYGIGALTTDPRPMVDAFSFAICLTAGIVCTLRYGNQYFWWLISGLAQVILWYVTLRQGGVASPGMLVNSLIYVANDFLAFTVSPWYNRKAREKMIVDDRKREAEL